MNVNDVVCVGAEPLAFVDYLAVDRVDPHLAAELAKGLNEGARQANVSIVGGETAVLPSIVNGFDLAGTCLGVVRKDRIITGERISPGDAIVGVASAGIHSNGLTLARKALAQAGVSYRRKLGDTTVGLALLEPTRIYVRAVMDLLSKVPDVHGISHITGSGLLNIPRLKKDVRYVLDNPLAPHPIFDLVQKAGRVETPEMYRTFNMGMGLAVVVPGDRAEEAASVLSRHHPAQIVGRVEAGKGIAVPSKGVEFFEAKASF
jgi:phosphoribosylformylglycinamidine cyclo-ligase